MGKIEVEGKGCIVARVIADSVSEEGKRITTFELEYPRFIHGELLTHRVFSRNAASSRAIPIEKMIEQVENSPATPIYWGLNKRGMQASEEHSDIRLCEERWRHAASMAATLSRNLMQLGLHKQICNRVLEPFQIMKTVVTATEWENFFELRDHKDAQPEFAELAKCMKMVMQISTPDLLNEGDWHVPYVATRINEHTGQRIYLPSQDALNSEAIPLGVALKVSASCCAQVSYRALDTSIEKAEKIYQMLIESEPVHASPIEHQATPLTAFHTFGSGLTHMSQQEPHTDQYWSNNFQGWVQYRELVRIAALTDGIVEL